MKVLRVLAVGLLLVLAVIGVGLWYVLEHENELGNLILAQIGKRTGLEIQTSNVRLGLGTRLVIVLEGADVVFNRQEFARLGAIRAVFSYWALLHRKGMPLHALVLERGTITIGGESLEGTLPQLAASRLEHLSHYLNGLSDVARRFDLVEITLLGLDHRPVAQHVNLSAYRPHYQGGRWPWIVNFNTKISRGSVAGTRLSGDLQIGNAVTKLPGLVDGRITFRDLPFRDIKLSNLRVSGRVDGEIALAVFADAQAKGDFTLTTRDIVAAGPAFGTPVALGKFWSRGEYRLSETRGHLANFELYRDKSRVLEADATIFDPYSAQRAITFAASGIAVELTNTPRWLRALRIVPPPIMHLAERIRSGRLLLTQVTLKTPQPLNDLYIEKLIRRLDINAALTGVSYVPPPELKLPTIYQFDVQLNYSRAIARITQASSQIGRSSISDISLEVDLAQAPDKIRYRLELASWLDIGELYDAGSGFIQNEEPGVSEQLLWLHGHSSIQLRARDTIEGLRAKIPREYVINAGLGDVEFELKKVPGAIWLNTGNIVLEPGRISVRRVVAIPLDQPGNIVVNGTILPQHSPSVHLSGKTAGGTQASFGQFRDFSVELHQLASDKWLPLIVNPDEIAVFGPLGGKLVANSKAGLEFPTITGKLTLDHGTVQPGFLRNPIMVKHSATLVLDGKGLILDLPGSSLEGEPLDFRMAVADFEHPEVRIDAGVARIDFEVMRFIRLPWSPSTPPVFFPVPVAGHIEAQKGNFDKLAMSQISTDFYHNSQTWRVSNFRATAFNGSIALTISGRARDDWINVLGTVRQMDAGPLFMLSGNNPEPRILGKLSTIGDLWANTNTDFFSTLAGTVSITMTDGTLNRFTLLKRILSLVNLKNYLTADFPDPRKSGVPFKTLDADFRGLRGKFYTDNLRLNGPVMDITARGNIDFANDTLDMEIDLLALQTVNWLLNNIPLIGKNLGGATKHLVGAYFQVSGPIDHPAIWPKPLTSVAEFVFRTLTLPINIVAPNTLQ